MKFFHSLYFCGSRSVHENKKKICTQQKFVLWSWDQRCECFAVVAQASSLHRSVSFLQFACRATGRGVVRASHIRSMKIKPEKISSEESGGIFLKVCTSENFLLYGIAYTDHAVFLYLIILVFLSACSFFFSELTLLHLMLFQVGACIRKMYMKAHVCIFL